MTLALVTAAPSLSLDGAAALVRAAGGRESPLWWTPGVEAPVLTPDGLSWLYEAARPASTLAAMKTGRAESGAALLAGGHAYRCTCSPERLRELAASALVEGREPRYDGRCRDRDPASGSFGAAGDGGLRVRDGLPDHRDRPIGPDVLDVLTLLIRGEGAGLVADRRSRETVRLAHALAERLGGSVSSPLEAPIVVGPDGAPLWRGSGRDAVPDLRDEGLEPEGVRGFLGVGAAVLPFDLEALGAANRDAILDMPEERVMARLGHELEVAGVRETPDRWPALFAAIRPRIRRFGDVARFLGFLAEPWRVPAIPAADRDQLSRVAAAVLEAAPGTAAELQEALNRLVAGRRSELHDCRRVLRWAITAREVAPSLARVWELLGPARALARLERAHRDGEPRT